MLNRLLVLAGICLLCVGCASSSGQEGASDEDAPVEREEPLEVRVTFAGVEYEDLDDVKGCFNAEPFDHCLDALREYVSENPHDAMEAGQFIRLNANHWVAMEFFEVVARSESIPDGFCEESDVELAIISALASPDFREEAIAGANFVLGEVCWDELHERMAEELSGTGAMGSFVEHFCELARETEGTYEACDEYDAAAAQAEKEAEERQEAASEPREEVIEAADLELDRENINLNQALVFENELRARVMLLPSNEDSNRIFVVFQGVDDAEPLPVGHHRFPRSSVRGQQYMYVTMHNDSEFTTVIQDGYRVSVWVPGQSSSLSFHRIEMEDEEIVEELSAL